MGTSAPNVTLAVDTSGLWRGVRVADVKLLKTPEAVGKGAARPASQNSKRRFSFKEKHALETLPKRIAELNSVKAGLDEKLADAKGETGQGVRVRCGCLHDVSFWSRI